MALAALEDQRTILSPFRRLLSKRCGARPENVAFDAEGARRRVREAILLSWGECERRAREDDEIYGETDGDTIWIARGLSLRRATLTLLHEAMHDSVSLLRTTRAGGSKELPCDLEHEVIYDVLASDSEADSETTTETANLFRHPPPA